MKESVIRNKYGEVTHFSHPPRIAKQADFDGATPAQVAEAYLTENKQRLGLAQGRIANVEDATKFSEDPDATVISYLKEKDITGSTLVIFQQSTMGLNIFNARTGVHVNNADMTVNSVQSSMHASVKITNLDAKERQVEKSPKKITAPAFRKMLRTIKGAENPRIARQVVYRYESDDRVEAEDHRGCFGGGGGHVHLDLSKADGFKDGEHYIVDEVLFRAPISKGAKPVNWRALVEPKTNTVLYIRALVAHATGMVFVRDPQTSSNATVTASSMNAQLNPFRSSVTLPGLTAATPQPLAGDFVNIMDFSIPTSIPPTVANPSGAFNFNARSDDFSAVNAYYHCDGLFRKMLDLGFTLSNYFDGTTFPVPVDHRATIGSSDGNEVNASAPGNALGNGLEEFRFALVQQNQALGMATSARVTWHEFGHAVLWDHVNSPNFGFAHSAGDAMAAILYDPNNQCADRFDTFPWLTISNPVISRRHDRAVSAGWAWFGANYNTRYGGEQVLGTTLFRLYRSLGGDSTRLSTRQRASDTTLYLILKGIGLLSSTTNDPRIYVTALQNADLTTTAFKGVPGGALHKVVRWAFEKQGLFQPGATPGGSTITTEGNPPEVDVYIDDGRNGEYQYQRVHWQNQDMWVRRSADGGTSHEQPLVGLTNYMYVKVKNRGSEWASSVSVDAYHCLPGTGLAFPDDWQPMTTPSISLGSPIPPGGSTIVGPFAFTPTQVGHECLLAIAHADGDPGNDTTLTGTISEGRFVPFDNNIGQRNVNPVMPSFQNLVAFMKGHKIWVRNPFRKVKVATIHISMPRILRKLGWRMKVVSRGMDKFEIGPRDRREVVFDLVPGADFRSQDIKRAIERGDATILVEVLLDGELSGGMSYPLSFDTDPVDREKRKDFGLLRTDLSDSLRRLLKGQTIDPDILSSRKIRRVSFDFDEELLDDKTDP